jgi:hypothetical protein
VPLAIYFTARRLAGEISERAFTRLIALLLMAQFLSSLEIFATMTMLGAVALGLGFVLASDQEVKQGTLALLKPLARGYATALIVISPYLYYFFAFGFTSKSVWSPFFSSADLLNFIVPTQANELGRMAFLKSVSV